MFWMGFTRVRFDLFEEIVPISALKKDGINEFRNVVFKLLPEGNHLFEENQNPFANIDKISSYPRKKYFDFLYLQNNHLLNNFLPT